METLSAAAVEAYRSGDYATALQRFEEAYALDPVSNLLYNIARCYEKMGDDVSAARHYARFISAPDADETARGKARTLLGVVQERLKAARMASESSPEGEPEESSESAKNPAMWGGSAAEGVRSSGEVGSDEGVGSMTAWTAIGTGAALLIVGTTCAVFADDAEVAFAETDDAGLKASHRSTAESFALAADLTFGLGAIAATTGVVLMVLDVSGEAGSDGARSGVAPMLGPTGVGITASGRF